MESVPLLRDIIILMGISIPISIVLTRAGLPTVVGFLVTGVIIGPYGFRLVTETNTVETLAQIGVVLLLFTIGLEFSAGRMLKIRREAVLGGGLQIALTVFFVWGLATIMGLKFQTALLLGFIISLSSSAIALKLLVDRGEVNSAHGNLSTGILLFQDISVVLMFMVVRGIGNLPVGLAGQLGGGAVTAIAKELGIALVAVFLIVLAVAYVVPKLFREVVKLRNREVFILTTVFVCLGTAWIASMAGVSLALGAFIAGLVISESEYANQIAADVLPMRDTFGSLFFISIGMMLDTGYLVAHLQWIALFTAAVFSTKALVLAAVGRVLRYPLRLSIVVGLNLAQIGEFSFILMKMGEDYGLMPPSLYQATHAVAVLGMAVTPFVFQRSAFAASSIGRLFRGKDSRAATDVPKTHLSNHVVIVGYGLNGRNLARVLKETGIEHLVMDINSDRVKKAKKDGHRASFGDSGHPEILKKAGMEKAKMLVVGITDPVSTRMTVKTARDLNPSVTIIVRTRYIDEVEELYRLGANEVIPEEFETSVEIFARVLKDYRVPGNIIQNQIDLVRGEGYAMLRNPSLSGERLARLASILETSVMDTYFVEKGSSVDGRTLGELDIRRATGGATVMAVVRKGKAHTNPKGDFSMAAGDMLVLLGSHAELDSAMKILNSLKA
ncbi:MAG: cation:proton antiporter [Deltaproteobacteria bacterium]|nr:cation:proton antiporter [Deltaproteobacteria bacterium]